MEVIHLSTMHMGSQPRGSYQTSNVSIDYSLTRPLILGETRLVNYYHILMRTPLAL